MPNVNVMSVLKVEQTRTSFDNLISLEYDKYNKLNKYDEKKNQYH